MKIHRLGNDYKLRMRLDGKENDVKNEVRTIRKGVGKKNPEGQGAEAAGAVAEAEKAPTKKKGREASGEAKAQASRQVL